MYVIEVTRTWCFTVKDLNWPHHHGQQVWRRRKLLSDFHLLEVEVDTVRGSEIFRYGGQNQNGQASIDAETYSEEHPLHSCAVWFRWEIVCWSYKDLMVLNEGKKWFPPSRPPGMTWLKYFHYFSSSRHEDDTEWMWRLWCLSSRRRSFSKEA